MIARLYDKKNDREVLKPDQKGNRMVMYEDKPMCFDNWDIDMYYTEKGWEVSNLVLNGPIWDRFVYQLNLRERSATH